MATNKMASGQAIIGLQISEQNKGILLRLAQESDMTLSVYARRILEEAARTQQVFVTRLERRADTISADVSTKKAQKRLLVLEQPLPPASAARRQKVG